MTLYSLCRPRSAITNGPYWPDKCATGPFRGRRRRPHPCSPFADRPISACACQPDGSEAEMCGNGIPASVSTFVTRASGPTRGHDRHCRGLQRLRLNESAGRVDSVEVNMGSPFSRPAPRPSALPRRDWRFDVTQVSMGNPMPWRSWKRQWKRSRWMSLGRRWSATPPFQIGRTLRSQRHVGWRNQGARVGAWGRAHPGLRDRRLCAAVPAACMRRTAEAVTVHLPGGDLRVAWPGPNHRS